MLYKTKVLKLVVTRYILMIKLIFL